MRTRRLSAFRRFGCGLVTGAELKHALVNGLKVRISNPHCLPHEFTEIEGRLCGIVYRRGDGGRICVSAQVSDNNAVHTVDARYVYSVQEE